MEAHEFVKYVPILQLGPFVLYPAPKGIIPQNSHFTYVDDTQTHVKIQSVGSQKEYLLPLILIEFVNPGVMRLTREVIPFNGSFV